MRHPLHKRAFYQVMRCLYSIVVLILLIMVGKFIYGGLTHLHIPTDISRIVSIIATCYILLGSKRVQSLVIDTDNAIKNAILKQ